MRKQKIAYGKGLETKIPWKCIKEAPSQGDFQYHAEWILANYDVQCLEDDAKTLLKPYGAWDDDDLTEYFENVHRLLWVSIMDCKEQNTQYWYGDA